MISKYCLRSILSEGKQAGEIPVCGGHRGKQVQPRGLGAAALGVSDVAGRRRDTPSARRTTYADVAGDGERNFHISYSRNQETTENPARAGEKQLTGEVYTRRGKPTWHGESRGNQGPYCTNTALSLNYLPPKALRGVTSKAVCTYVR